MHERMLIKKERIIVIVDGIWHYIPHKHLFGRFGGGDVACIRGLFTRLPQRHLAETNLAFARNKHEPQFVRALYIERYALVDFVIPQHLVENLFAVGIDGYHAGIRT